MIGYKFLALNKNSWYHLCKQIIIDKNEQLKKMFRKIENLKTYNSNHIEMNQILALNNPQRVDLLINL